MQRCLSAVAMLWVRLAYITNEEPKGLQIHKAICSQPKPARAPVYSHLFDPAVNATHLTAPTIL